MPGRECYHCKQWIEEGEPHDCWTTTEAALTRDLSEDLQDGQRIDTLTIIDPFAHSPEQILTSR